MRKSRTRQHITTNRELTQRRDVHQRNQLRHLRELALVKKLAACALAPQLRLRHATRGTSYVNVVFQTSESLTKARWTWVYVQDDTRQGKEEGGEKRSTRT